MHINYNAVTSSVCMFMSMQIIATNISLWVETVVLETVEEIEHGGKGEDDDHHFQQGEQSIIDFLTRPQKVDDSGVDDYSMLGCVGGGACRMLKPHSEKLTGRLVKCELETGYIQSYIF